MQKLILGIFIIALANCSQANQEPDANHAPSAVAREASDIGDMLGGMMGSGVDGNLETPEENALVTQEAAIRKLITSSNLQIRIENLDTGINRLNEIMNKYGTYASSISVYENSRNYTLKVPAIKYKHFLDEIMKIGKIINYDETTEDVTLKYYDLESRLNTKKELIKTYQNYLNKAKNIEEILSVESKIAQLQAEIDDVGKQFRLLNDLIDYSTIRLRLLGPVAANNYEKETIWESIKSLMTGFGDYVSAVIIILLAIIVYGVPSVIILLLLYWLLFGKIGILKKIFKFISGNK